MKHFKLIFPNLFGLILFINVAEGVFNFNDIDNNRNFKSVPTTVKTYENDTVLLPCYHNAPYDYVRWHRNDVVLADSRQPGIITAERIHLWSNGSLQVSNVKNQDTGEYYCEIVANGGHAVQIHAIEVQYAPTVITIPSGVVERPVGDIFDIDCDVTGVPLPVVTWRRNGIDISDGLVTHHRRLTIQIQSREESGPIECVATNSVGQMASDGVHLNVLFTPIVTAVQPVVHTKIMMRVHLECHVISAPIATIHWFHHGVPVMTSHHITRRDTEIQSNRSLTHYYSETKHILILKQIRDSDLGLYECRAENKIGFKGVTIDLTGRPKPCIFKINPGVQSSTSHYIIWQTESMSPIVEFKLKFRQIPSGNVTPQNRFTPIEWTELTIPAEFSEGQIHSRSYNLQGLQPASVYEVAVLARNRFGWSDNSKIVRFATGGEVELPNYSTESEMQYDDIEDNMLQENTPSSRPHISELTYNSSTRINVFKMTTILFYYILFRNIIL